MIDEFGRKRLIGWLKRVNWYTIKKVDFISFVSRILWCLLIFNFEYLFITSISPISTELKTQRNGEKYEWFPVTSGVPQGSEMGQIFCVIFINPVDQLIEHLATTQRPKDPLTMIRMLTSPGCPRYSGKVGRRLANVIQC